MLTINFCVTKVKCTMIIAVFKKNRCLSDYVYVRVGILLTRGKHLHDCIISIRGEVSAHKTSLTLPLYYVYESHRSCICVLGVYILPFSTILIFDFLNGPDSVVFVRILPNCDNQSKILNHFQYQVRITVISIYIYLFIFIIK